MKRPHLRDAIFFILLILGGTSTVFAQDNDDSDKPTPKSKPIIMGGFYVGSYFANKATANAYSGYGFDVNGQRNNFANSWIYQKIFYQYGGGYGQYDQIAQALKVDQGQWSFSESDMATNMHYTPVIMVGFNLKIPLDKKSSLILNANGTKLNVQGNFTIETLNNSTLNNNNPAFNNNVNICSIKGQEERLMLQLGFQHLFGPEDGNVHFLLEGGFVGTLAEFTQDMININGLVIDMTSYLNNAAYPSLSVPIKRPVGFGVGAYAATGINVEMNPKITIQLIYTLSDERIKLASDQVLKLQNGLGLRIYYKLHRRS